jgi:hypothetical protein
VGAPLRASPPFTLPASLPVTLPAAMRALPVGDGGFDWFARGPGDLGSVLVSSPSSFVAAPPAVGVPGLARRVPGAHLAPDLRDRRPVRAAQPTPVWQPRDPEGVQAAFDSYTVAWRRAGSAADRRPDPATSAMEGYQ